MGRPLPIYEPNGGGHQREPISIAIGGGPEPSGAGVPRRHPDWIRSRLPTGPNYQDLKGLLRDLTLNTVCEEAQCPNIDRKSTRLNSSHSQQSRMPSSA